MEDDDDEESEEEEEPESKAKAAILDLMPKVWGQMLRIYMRSLLLKK